MWFLQSMFRLRSNVRDFKHDLGSNLLTLRLARRTYLTQLTTLRDLDERSSIAVARAFSETASSDPPLLYKDRISCEDGIPVYKAGVVRRLIALKQPSAAVAEINELDITPYEVSAHVRKPSFGLWAELDLLPRAIEMIRRRQLRRIITQINSAGVPLGIYLE